MIWPLLNKFPFIASLVSAALLIGCASGTLNEQPKALPETLPTAVDVDVVWWHILGDEFSEKAFGTIKPQVIDNTILTVLVDGSVVSITADGEVTSLGQHPQTVVAPLTVDDAQMLIADQEGYVTLYDVDFNTIWSLSLNALTTEKALMTDERIFVQTIDGRINAIERITGRLLWSFQDAEPELTLTGTSTPTLIQTNQGVAIVSGLANGKLVALNVVDGSTIWEYRITRASGKTDVSRLVDVDAQISLVGDRLIASSYQGDLIVVETATGRVLQAKPFSTYRSILTTESQWFGVKSNSHLVALDPVTLEENWVNEDMEYRQLSELVVSGDYVTATDAEGFLHVFNQSNGKWVGSRHIDWRGAKTDPVPFNNGLLVQGHSTRLKYVELN